MLKYKHDDDMHAVYMVYTLYFVYDVLENCPEGKTKTKTKKKWSRAADIKRKSFHQIKILFSIYCVS